MAEIDYSVIIPVYNEENNLQPLYSKLKPALDELKKTYEIVFVDDGSDDTTFQKLFKMASEDPQVKVIRFRRNFGQSAALMAGLDNASGKILISMDGDLQNDPQDIRLLIAKLDEGYDIVCGWRKTRKDSMISKKLPSLFSNWVASKLYGLNIHDFGCTLRVYKKEATKDLLIYGELHRYLPAIIASKGYKIQEVEVTHNPRLFGKTKYDIRRLLKGTLDLLSLYIIERYLTRPMHLFGTLGTLSILGGTFIGAYLSILRLLYGTSISERPLLLLAVLMIIFGAQFLVLGFIGEMLARLRFEVDRESLYDIKSKLNMDSV